jgi:hypothetical protein
LIVGLSAALGAALEWLRSRSLPAENFAERQASHRAIPFVWLGDEAALKPGFTCSSAVRSSGI